MYRPPEDIKQLRRKGLPWIGASLILLLLVVSVGFVLIFLKKPTDNASGNVTISTSARLLNESVSELELKSISALTDDDPSTPTIAEECHPPRLSPVRRFRQAVVTSPAEMCSEIGRSILLRGGNAVDSAVSTEFCLSAMLPQSTGLGGGMMMLIRMANGTSFVIDALPQSPRSITQHTFAHNPLLAARGYSSIATPGWLAGMWTAFQRFGSSKISWEDLIMPTVQLLETGIPAHPSLVESIRKIGAEIAGERSMGLYSASLADGDLLSDSALSSTLRKLARSDDPVQTFYRGELAATIAHEMRERGGLISKLDLANYNVRVSQVAEKPLEVGGYSLLGPPLPSTYSIVQRIVVELAGSYHNATNISANVDYYDSLITAQRTAMSSLHRIGDVSSDDVFGDDAIDSSVEAILNGSLGENDVHTVRMEAPSDRVSSHINVVDRSRMIVAMSSSLNQQFGSQRRSEQLGFVWNNHMNAFSLDETGSASANGVAGSKRPRSSAMPIILLKDGKPVFIVGVTGSSHVIPTAAQTILSYIVGLQAVDAPRLHATTHSTLFESHLPMSMLSALHSRGHHLNPLLSSGGSITNAVSIQGDRLTAFCDYRQPDTQCAEGY